MRDPEREDIRKGVYGRLERDDPERWERLRGCAVTHRVFGAGRISTVLMPKRGDPLHLVISFGSEEKTFYLSSCGDLTKFPQIGLPPELAQILDRAEQEIALEERRRTDALRRRADDVAAAALARQEQADLLRAQQRQAAAREESARAAQVEARLAAIRETLDRDQAPSPAEVRLLLAARQDELLLAYHARTFARTGAHRAILQATAAWRAVQRPACALRATELLLPSLNSHPASTRAAVCVARGSALLDLHDVVEAKVWALRAIAANGGDPEANQLLGAILLASGDVLEGTRQFATARHLAGARGAGRIEKAQHTEVCRQLQGLEPAGRAALAEDLRRLDPQRYGWVGTYLRQAGGLPRPS